MRGLGLCCEGVEYDINGEAEPNKEKIIVPVRVESFNKSRDHATVIPAKRKSVKKMVCSCFIQCFSHQCSKTKTKTTNKAVYGTGNNFWLLCLIDFTCIIKLILHVQTLLLYHCPIELCS
ncbi:hypothetical protein JHK82_015046 [Glycine max]|nr:hypothetical protein JHK85_015420 [Glycine max]KAG5045659.1 hypothetical protein JHK86_015065 [Glycine max]KAG5148165.1 hypothetical protein JHK82_015046 [Glycine max]